MLYEAFEKSVKKSPFSVFLLNLLSFLENRLKTLYNTAIVNMKPNEIPNQELKIKEKQDVLTEKKEIRKNLDVFSNAFFPLNIEFCLFF